MDLAVDVGIPSHDLAVVVDSSSDSTQAHVPEWHIYWRKTAPAVQETMVSTKGIDKAAHNLALVIDASN
jgi:hypothetical protein